jgi:GTP 3',8-cyclase
MTTNGSLLRQAASALKASGLTRVNVSLDSLDTTRFAQLTQGDGWTIPLGELTKPRMPG